MQRLPLVLLFVVYLAGSVSAHFPEGVLYKVFPFADEQIPVMDGDLSDWDIVPEEYWLNLTDHEEVLAKRFDQYDRTDLDIRRVAVG